MSHRYQSRHRLVILLSRETDRVTYQNIVAHLILVFVVPQLRLPKLSHRVFRISVQPAVSMWNPERWLVDSYRQFRQLSVSRKLLAISLTLASLHSQVIKCLKMSDTNYQSFKRCHTLFLGMEKVTTSLYIGTSTTSQPRKMRNYWATCQRHKQSLLSEVFTIMK